MQSVGLNIGNSHVKAVIIDDKGRERVLPPFPSQIAAATSSSHGIARVETTTYEGKPYWIGVDAELGNPWTIYDQARLDNPLFIPILSRAAVERLACTESIVTFSCLPATWMAKTKELIERIKEGASNIASGGILSEPVAAAYSVLLDANGNKTSDQVLNGDIGIVDIGGGTVDCCVLHGMKDVHGSARTIRKGLVTALTSIQSLIAGQYNRELSLFATDTAVRDRAVNVAGRRTELPNGWDDTMLSLADSIVTFLDSQWGSGNQLDKILIAGGGGNEPLITDAIQRKYRHAEVLPDPQMAIARGCARRARMHQIQATQKKGA